MTLAGAVEKLRDVIEWRTALMAALVLLDAAALVAVASLPLGAAPVQEAHRGELLGLAAVWTALAVALAARRDVRGREITAAVVVGIVLVGVHGSLVPDVHWRWLSIATLPLVAAVATVHHRGWPLVGLVAGAVATAVGLLRQLDLATPYLVFNAVAVTVLIAAPAVVVSALATALERARARSEAAARTDPLTGLLNRHGVAQAIPPLVRSAARPGSALAVLLLDVDHFKAVNDTWGHGTGDRVLQAVAGCVRAGMRSHDLVARWGGEELLVVTAVADDQDLVAVGERLRAAVAAHRVEALPPVTVSIGTDRCWVPEGGIGPGARASDDELRELVGAMVDQADGALYEAKASGRDCVVHAALDAQRSPSTEESPVAGVSAGARGATVGP
ncbi:GGDEF domain-containing protein [Streptomyces sp. NP160]|uniref:GGDEF domain-containing protein n=1 Tax=Streptomyces sp. NP160 TaxID=2586637 RepID=UPI00111A3722|nr:GGDEF domain-containing protein [Streptomyces sp. NP160]TNM69607.1 GGDEF domain-containing protein [Streptomyces sp. NP160]